LGFLFENGTGYNGDWVNSDVVNVTRVGNLTVTTHTEMLSSFSKFYQIQVVPAMGDAFNTFFPAVLISIAFLVLTNVINRILVALRMESYQFGTEIVTPDQLKDGKRVLERQKKVMVGIYTAIFCFDSIIKVYL